MRRKNQRGLTLVELIVAFSILMMLSGMAVPLARYKVRRDKERDLRMALLEMRTAINKYKDDADQNKLGTLKIGSEGYPETLEMLVEGVKLAGQVEAKKKYLRRIPMDPFTRAREWGLRSMQDDPKSTSWGGQHVRRIFEDDGQGAGRDGVFRMVTLMRRFTVRGFTLIELMIAMAVISILLSVAVPQYNKALIRSKETILKQNLFAMRNVIDEYTYDKAKAPQSLEDLVQAGYLRKVPLDPITGNNTWRLIMEDATNSVNQSEPGLFDVRSGSDKTSLEGTPYAEW